MPAKFKIQISNPCHEEWDEMQLDTKGKFCGSCQRAVIDFTQFSDRALQDWFNQNQGESCGRFKQEQLNRYIGTKNRSFFAIFKPGLIAASVFTFLSAPKFTYSKNINLLTPVLNAQHRQISDEKDGAYTFIKGSVYDQNGIGLNNINVELKDQNIYTKTAADGSFYIKIKKPRNRTISGLIFTSNSFETKMCLFLLGEEKEILVVLQAVNKMDFSRQVAVDELSAKLVGRLGGISIKTTLTRRIASKVLKIFR